MKKQISKETKYHFMKVYSERESIAKLKVQKTLYPGGTNFVLIMSEKFNRPIIYSIVYLLQAIMIEQRIS